MLIIDYREQTQKVLQNVMLGMTVIDWHPRRPDFFVLGTAYGKVSINHINSLEQDSQFIVPEKIPG